jgi:hypothetical protein
MIEQRYAILIASSYYPKDPAHLEPLRCPNNDVDALEGILAAADYGAFVKPVVLKDLAHYDVLRQINLTLSQASRDDLVLIYYSGHGKLNRSGRLHLTTVDTEVNLLDTTSIPVERIRDLIDMSPSKKIILILDCCYSGRVRDAFLKSGVDDHLKQVQIDQGIYIITASTGIQVAREKEGDKYSHFTKYIIEGLKEGKADTNNDGFVSITDLFRYTEGQMRQETSQVPMRWDLNVQGNELIISRTGDNWREKQHEIIKQKLVGLEVDRWPNAVNAYRQLHGEWVSPKEQDVLIGEVTAKLKAEKIVLLDLESQDALEREDWQAAISKLQAWLGLETTSHVARERLEVARRHRDSSEERRFAGVKIISYQDQIITRLESVLKSRYSKYILPSATLSGLVVLTAVFFVKPLIGCLLMYGILSAACGFIKPGDPWRLGLWLSFPCLILFGFSIGMGLFFGGYFLVLFSQDIPLGIAGLLLAYSGAHLGAWLSSLKRTVQGLNKLNFGSPR